MKKVLFILGFLISSISYGQITLSGLIHPDGQIKFENTPEGIKCATNPTSIFGNFPTVKIYSANQAEYAIAVPVDSSDWSVKEVHYGLYSLDSWGYILEENNGDNFNTTYRYRIIDEGGNTILSVDTATNCSLVRDESKDILSQVYCSNQSSFWLYDLPGEIYTGDKDASSDTVFHYTSDTIYSYDTVYVYTSDTVYYVDTTTTGKMELILDEDYEMTVYPNPTSHRTFVSYNIPSDEYDAQIVLYNNLGQEIYRESVYQGQENLTVDVAQFDSGTYYLNMITSKGITKNKTLVISR